MKITLISTFGSGGAAVACKRLSMALGTIGVEARVLVAARNNENASYHRASASPIGVLKDKANFVAERLMLYPLVKGRKNLFAFSPANTGTDISKHPLIQDADVVHIHWFNQGFMSLNDLQALIDTGKPIVWTLHDMWSFTGGCHYSGECRNYESSCGNCPYLRFPSANDLSHQVWLKKSGILDKAPIQFVTCSKWLGNVAATSELLKKKDITAIPNPLDTDVFKPVVKNIARKALGISGENKFYLLFAAANLKDERKGFAYLKSSLELLAKQIPNFSNTVELILFGKLTSDIQSELPITVRYLGQLSGIEAIVNAYSAADAYIIPSLQDNLPNTIMEAMACGTPVVGFKTGGIPEMIDHLQNGYLADYESTEDLAKGIQWTMERGNQFDATCESARTKVLTSYDNQLVANKYLAIYNNAIDKR